MSIKDEELKGIKDMLLKMAVLVEAAIKDSVKSLLERDVELARKVIKNDHVINSYDVHIDEACIKFIARRQPVGKDLRFITTGMKITTDLERIADHAVNIAQRAVELSNEPFNNTYNDISRMREVAQRMIKDAIDSFVNEDKRLAKDVIMRDDEVDDLNDIIIDELMAIMTKHPETIVHATKLSYISRNLERIADHTTNIAEMVIYMTEGRIVRHLADTHEPL
ncbi:phosphate transport system regulatory protein PhoU [Candidatus Magnetobacterium bavaricum]|uniref:Phosphate-specific transport system accessory protein PhoU n=1 Tax=Candidatus Magnetobacterium bavaricum TaxID=29290 RepID=A0A0F3GN02_9BACT|nr:phosphate transport system regulatory protein PhoU [Candidatus Magnetobacterium bavaricum]